MFAGTICYLRFPLSKHEADVPKRRAIFVLPHRQCSFTPPQLLLTVTLAPLKHHTSPAKSTRAAALLQSFSFLSGIISRLRCAAGLLRFLSPKPLPFLSLTRDR